MLEDLAGKRVLVTGASTGIGAAAAKAFAECGGRIAVHYNASGSEAEAVVDAIRGAGGEADLVQGDVSRSSEAKRVVDEAAHRLGGLDIIINNAGALLRRVKLEEMDDTVYDAVLDLNIRSVVMASKAAVPHLRQSGGGVIIHTSSIAARNGGGPGAGLYASAKAFVSNLTRSMARELAPDRIRVNAVSPGTILTPFHERYSTADMLEATRRTIPLARLGTPEDCVGTFLYFASERMSGYVTGQVVEVNGGQFMV